MIDRVSGVSIDHEGKHMGPDFTIRFPAADLEPVVMEPQCTWVCPYMESGCGETNCNCEASDIPVTCEVIEVNGKKVWALKVDVENAVAEIVPSSQITAAANAAGFYGDDATRFAREVDNATEFLIQRVSAAGGDKRRFRDRRSKAVLARQCMEQAGVPQAYWPADGLWSRLVAGLKVALTLGKYAAPPPWNIVIAAVMVAVERYL